MLAIAHSPVTPDAELKPILTPGGQHEVKKRIKSLENIP